MTSLLTASVISAVRRFWSSARDAGRVLLRRDEEGVGLDDAVALARDLFEQEADGHEVVLHAGAEDFGGLAEDARNLVETRDVVLVVLDRVEGHGRAEGRRGRCGRRSSGRRASRTL